MKKYLFTIFLSISSLLASPSCYDYYKVERQEIPSSFNTAVFILIDETTLFNESLKKEVWDNVLKFIQAGNYVYIAKFSAFINNNYNTKVFDFSLDTPLTQQERYDTRKDTLAKLDKCLNDQFIYVAQNAQKSIFDSFQSVANAVPKSDILFSLKDFSENVIKVTNAQRKIVILASDMLENSSVTSFYSKSSMRFIKIKEELENVEENYLWGNFDEAEIYIIGAGLVSSQKTNYRDPKKLGSLKAFWSSYFEKSNAKLMEMGQPSLKKFVQ